MEWNWLQSLLFGLISGFSEFLPVSADAHQRLFAHLTGAGNEIYPFRLLCHISSLLALLLSCRPQLSRFARERRIAAASSKRRRHQSDLKSLLDMRLLRVASGVMLLSFVLYKPAGVLGNSLWILAALMAVNGLLLFLPQLFPSGNKDSHSVSGLDAFIFGLGGALSVLPGISRTGAVTSAGLLRGSESRYATEIALLMYIPALVMLIAFDVYFLFAFAGAFSLSMLLCYILAVAAAFISAYFGIVLLRFLAVKIGFSGFAYYCWGAALFLFVLYLTT